MRVKLDENLPESLVGSLSALGHTVDTVRGERLVGRPDAEVWQAAQTSGCFFITPDLDFSDLRKYAPGTHQGLLLVRLRLPGRWALAARLLNVFHSMEVQSWLGCFVLVADRKTRVHRPKRQAIHN